MLRAHRVGTLDDRVKLLTRMVWLGAQAVDPREPPVGGLRDPKMREIGLRATQSCPERNDMCELEAIYTFVTMTAPDGHPNVRYTGDIALKDTYQTAYRTLQYRGGDCDDHAVLSAVLAMENGFQTRFRITSNTGASWDHIYCMAGYPKNGPTRWIALDTTLGPRRFAKQPPEAKHRDFNVSEVTR
jgi:hypothetical protein